MRLLPLLPPLLLLPLLLWPLPLLTPMLLLLSWIMHSVTTWF